MKPIEDAAFTSVGRACGFAGLAVLCIILGMAFQPVAAAKAGGLLTLSISLYLVLRALRAPTRPFQLTEAWLILAKADRPPQAIAQQIIGGALREAYLWFARFAATVSAAFFIMALLFTFIFRLNL
ncbi:MAG TPA: hypothetical protein VMX97_16865 [Hyphomicrobiaceae bacterium]|nr:hypothetical protein [Hyphomicrobiaceae bacterium]